MAELDQKVIKFWYKNYKGVISERTVMPISIYWGETTWHKTCWLLKAFDLDRNSNRLFALEDCVFSTEEELLSSVPSI